MKHAAVWDGSGTGWGSPIQDAATGFLVGEPTRGFMIHQVGAAPSFPVVVVITFTCFLSLLWLLSPSHAFYVFPITPASTQPLDIPSCMAKYHNITKHSSQRPGRNCNGSPGAHWG